MTHILAAAMIGVIVLFGAANFATGRSMKPWWPTRSVYLTAPIVMAILALAAWLNHADPIRWASVGLGWACWRSVLGWSSFGGSMNPTSLQSALRELLRNAVSSIFPLAAFIYAGVQWPPAAFAMGMFAIFTTAIAVWYGAESLKGHDVDPEVDALDGVGFGMAFAALLLALP